MEKITHGASSMIRGLCYDETTNSLFVRFNTGALYQVSNVNKDMADAFVVEGEKLDGSVGKLYNTLIKSQPSAYPAAVVSTEDTPLGLPI